MNFSKENWEEFLGKPTTYQFERYLKLVAKYEVYGCNLEIYHQANGPKTYQRVCIVTPKKIYKPLPAVVVPFYSLEMVLGYDFNNGVEVEEFKCTSFPFELANRGYISISADTFYKTYPTFIEDTPFHIDPAPWITAINKLKETYPNWTGMGKLVADTKLLIDALTEDQRVDNNRIGIMGHSLGGKIALYSGFLDDRIKVVVANDPGICWEQTNWESIWYWGDKVEKLKKLNVDHSDLLSLAPNKPFCLIAGLYDNFQSFKLMQKVKGYKENFGSFEFFNHATSHYPPPEAVEYAYDFLDKYLK